MGQRTAVVSTFTFNNQSQAILHNWHHICHTCLKKPNGAQNKLNWHGLRNKIKSPDYSTEDNTSKIDSQERFVE